MRTRDAALALLIAAGALAGCAALRPRAASEWQGGEAYARDVESGRGAWARIETFHGVRNSSWLQGEILAVTRDSLWVLTTDGLVAIRTRAASQVEVVADARPGGEPPWAGYGLPASGRPAMRRSATMATEVLRASPDELRAYARFPQGPPPGVDLRALHLH